MIRTDHDGANFASQVLDVRIDGSVADHTVDDVDGIERLRTQVAPARALGEGGEQAKLDRRHVESNRRWFDLVPWRGRYRRRKRRAAMTPARQTNSPHCWT